MRVMLYSVALFHCALLDDDAYSNELTKPISSPVTTRRDTTSLRWRARVAKTTTATIPSADSETKDGFLKTSLSNDKEKRHIHNNGCFGTGLSWLDGMAAGAVGSSLLALQQRHLLPIVTHTAAVSTLVMGPYAAYQNRKLRAMGGLRSEHNRLRGDVNEFKVQNEVLLRRMQRLDGAVSSLESAERELSVIVKDQSELERLQRAVARRNQIMGEMKQCLVQQVLQDILAVVVRSDRDSDFQISPQELEVLVLRMKAIAGVQFNERNFRGLMAAGDRRIASVFSMIRTLMKDDDDRNDIFTFHPEDLVSHGNHVV
jgi:hypothetical protein